MVKFVKTPRVLYIGYSLIKLFESEVGHKTRFECPVSRGGWEGDISSGGVGRLVLELCLRAHIDL